MVRVGGFLKSQNRIRRQRARGRFISPYQVGGTIFGKSTMARYPLMNTTHRIDPMVLKHLKQRSQMKGGTIFSESARRRTNPWRMPSTSTRINPEPWRVKQALRRMKGGDLRKVLWANQAKARRQRQGIKRRRR